MSTLLRSDRGVLAPPVSATIYEGRVARVHNPGDALMYATGPEHRDAEELAKLAEQLSGVKVYLGHPPKFPAKDSGQKVVGFVESGRVDEDTAVARIVVTDAAALDAINSGTYELSLGYQCILGEGRYQKNIVLDHLAIVDRARCGPACSMRRDEGNTMDMCSTCDKPECAGHEDKSDCACKKHTSSYNTGESMSDPNTDTLTAEIAALKEKLDAAHAALTALEVEATNARKDADAAKALLEAAEAVALTAKTEAETVKSDAAEEVAKAKADAGDFIAKELDARVAARVALVVEASRFKLDGDVTKMSDRDIKVAVIKHVDGDEVPADKSDAFVDGVYFGALKRGVRADESRSATRVAINEMRKEGAAIVNKNDEKSAREKMARESAEAWKKTVK